MELSIVGRVLFHGTLRSTNADHGITPKFLARSAGVISVGRRSNVTPARCSARAIRATQPCWPRSGTLSQSPVRIAIARRTKLNRPYFCFTQEYAYCDALIRSAADRSRYT